MHSTTILTYPEERAFPKGRLDYFVLLEFFSKLGSYFLRCSRTPCTTDQSTTMIFALLACLEFHSLIHSPCRPTRFKEECARAQERCDQLPLCLQSLRTLPKEVFIGMPSWLVKVGEGFGRTNSDPVMVYAGLRKEVVRG